MVMNLPVVMNQFSWFGVPWFPVSPLVSGSPARRPSLTSLPALEESTHIHVITMKYDAPGVSAETLRLFSSVQTLTPLTSAHTTIRFTEQPLLPFLQYYPPFTVRQHTKKIYYSEDTVCMVCVCVCSDTCHSHIYCSSQVFILHDLLLLSKASTSTWPQHDLTMSTYASKK